MILPATPLEMFYRPLRKVTGNKLAKFEKIRTLLCDRHGAVGATFLSELFRRSVKHAEFYRNVEETFCPDRVDPKEGKKYARKLVQHMFNTPKGEGASLALRMVDYEIFPFTTKCSCTERGKPATSAGSGGMDMLLAAREAGAAVPAVGEIKADTEQVGPTFALVQSLMYASQIATPNQFERLARIYEQDFGHLKKDNPSVEIIIILESVENCIDEDLAFAKEIASSMLNDVTPRITELSAIRFLQCPDNNGFEWSEVD